MIYDAANIGFKADHENRPDSSSYLAHEYSYPTPVLAIPTSVLAVVRAVSVVFLLLFLGRYSKRPNIPNIIFASRCDTVHYKSLFFYRPTIIPNMIPTMKGNIF